MTEVSMSFQVGGLEEAYLAAKSLFLSMGKSTIYCGGAGNGSAAKICNNLAMAVSMLGVSEAFSLGQSLGISAGTLTKIFNSSSGRCWSSDSYNPVPGVMEGVPSSRNYNGGFASKLMDIQYCYTICGLKIKIGKTFCLKPRSTQVKIISDLPDLNKSAGDDYPIVSGNWEFVPNDELRLFPITREFLCNPASQLTDNTLALTKSSSCLACLLTYGLLNYTVTYQSPAINKRIDLHTPTRSSLIFKNPPLALLAAYQRVTIAAMPDEMSRQMEPIPDILGNLLGAKLAQTRKPIDPRESIPEDEWYLERLVGTYPLKSGDRATVDPMVATSLSQGVLPGDMQTLENYTEEQSFVRMIKEQKAEGRLPSRKAVELAEAAKEQAEREREEMRQQLAEAMANKVAEIKAADAQRVLDLTLDDIDEEHAIKANINNVVLTSQTENTEAEMANAKAVGKSKAGTTAEETAQT
ncbi:hypothetical protein TEA_014873 [Camellia sinensis var. sinensis]|uniref:3-hydroxyisobutyrate dehydrogenase n=1 Tax=Camellia sinensis var. sinensis TaxID=542762 RepID=A0A4S4DMV7_CAMSN|nr:hypothetical protein TEA_014873 [Camellia sinensis var. sinensis]